MRNCIDVNPSKSHCFTLHAGHTTEEADLILTEAGVLHNSFGKIVHLEIFSTNPPLHIIFTKQDDPT